MDKSESESLSYEEDENLTFKDKLIDFVDGNDTLGCGFIFVLAIATFFGGCSYYQKYKQDKLTEQKQCAQAEKEAPKLEPLYILKLLPLTGRLNKKNAHYVFSAAKYTLLIDYPEKERVLNLLQKKYQKNFNNFENKIEFQKSLLDRLDSLNTDCKKQPQTIQKAPAYPYASLQIKTLYRGS